MERINVSFDETLAQELRHLVPRRQRSLFICEAVRDKLDQLRQERATREAAGIWSSEGRDQVEEEVRALRDSWVGRLEKIDG